MVHTLKICPKYLENKNLSDFFKCNRTKSGRSSYCKVCYKSWHKSYYIKNRDKKIQASKEYAKNNKEQKKAYYKKRYKDNYSKESIRGKTYGAVCITKEDYAKRFEQQEGCCSICKIPQSKLHRPLDVDPCHNTGKVRGLLCNLCNSGLGRFKDNIDFLEAAIKYLKNQ